MQRVSSNLEKDSALRCATLCSKRASVLSKKDISSSILHVSHVILIHRGWLRRAEGKATSLVSLSLKMSHVHLKVHSNLLDCKHPLVAQLAFRCLSQSVKTQGSSPLGQRYCLRGEVYEVVFVMEGKRKIWKWIISRSTEIVHPSHEFERAAV